MSQKWHVLYYETAEGKCQIQNFIDFRREREQAKIFGWISLLEQHGPTLPRPYADLLTDGIHELRITLSGEHLRILYFFCFKDIIVLTHAFIKHTSEVPHSEIKKAKAYWDDFLSRYDKKKLKEAINEKF